MTAPLNHILCIDDEEDILQVAKLALEAVGGFRVSLCRGSESAVEQALQVKPDLVLLDVMMPVMDGPATLKKLHEPGACPDLPVIFMTAKARPEELRAFLDLGAIGVLSKPFDPMTLPDQIRSLWNQYHERNA
jgi:two-component system OmpR family response regulator